MEENSVLVHVVQKVLANSELVFIKLHLSIFVPKVDHGVELVIAHDTFDASLAGFNSVVV